MQGLVEALRPHCWACQTRNRSFSDSRQLLTDCNCVIFCRILGVGPIGALRSLRQAGQQQWRGWVPRPATPASPRQPRLCRPLVHGTRHALIISANTYVSAKKDGWQQLYNLLACRSTGPALHNPLDSSQVLSRYLTTALLPLHSYHDTHTQLFASTLFPPGQHYFEQLIDTFVPLSGTTADTFATTQPSLLSHSRCAPPYGHSPRSLRQPASSPPRSLRHGQTATPPYAVTARQTLPLAKLSTSTSAPSPTASQPRATPHTAKMASPSQ